MAINQSRRLYSYWRSSAAFRVRIVLNLKQLPYEIMPVHLLEGGGQQHSVEYNALNPQELIPTLVDGERVIRQSIAIIEYLDEIYAHTPMLPPEPRARARVRAIALAVACDIHPLNNLRVMKYLESEFSMPQPERDTWTRHWIAEGFDAIEDMVAGDGLAGVYCNGDTPSMADALLIPQVYNARRFGLDMSAYPTLTRIDAACGELEAFKRARPENQPDAPQKQ
jgi:maleylacetoacetate isomerase